MGDNADEDTDMIEAPVAVETEETDNWYNNQDRGAGHGQGQWDFQYNRGLGQENSF